MNETLGLVMIFAPLFLIAWIANIAEARRLREEPYEGVAIMAYVLIVLLYLLGLCGGLLLQVASFMAIDDPALLQGVMTDGTFESLPLLALGLWLPSLLGIIFLLPPVRGLVARVTPLDPQSPVHAIALSLSMLVLINLFMTLGVGLGNLADLLAATGEETGAGQDNTLLALWLQQILTAVLAMVGVGWLSRLDWRRTFARLGLTVPSSREWLIGVGTGLALVPFVLLIEFVASLFGLGASADVERLTEELLGSLFTSPIGILTLGLAAALGEETLFRGAITPRFGLILSSVFFALVHSNYGITLSTLVVFLLGMLLGWLRLRYNTSTAMLTHAVYNMSLGLLAFLSTLNLDV